MRRLWMLGAGVALAACGDNTGPENASAVSVRFSAGSAAATAATSTDGQAGDLQATTSAEGFAITSGDDDIMITKAQFVVRDLKLKKASAACEDDDEDDDALVIGASVGRSDDDDDDDDENCPTIRVGPFLVDVPLTGAEGTPLTVELPAGTYSAVSLRLHKVSSSSPLDLAFRNANPDFRDISVRLEGTFNGQPFTFIGDVNAKISVPLDESLVIGEGGDEFTIAIDMGTWFARPGGGLYSPAEANTPGQVRAKVQNNIRSAFRAYGDDDDDN